MNRPARHISPGSVVKSRRFGRYVVKMTRHGEDTWQVIFQGPNFLRWRASRDDLYIHEQYQRYSVFSWLLDKLDLIRRPQRS